MKILQKRAFGGDWGCFVYFSGKAGSEHFSWKDEVGNASDAKQAERGTFYSKLGEDRQNLIQEVEEEGGPEKQKMSFDNRLLSIQLAELFGELQPGNETGTNWGKESHKKTFDVLNRLTKMGKNVDKPSEFKGLTLVIREDGEIELEGAGIAIDPTDIVVTNPADVLVTDPMDIVVTNPADVLVTDPTDVVVTNPEDVLVTDPMDVVVTNPEDVLVTDPTDVVVTNPEDVPGADLVVSEEEIQKKVIAELNENPREYFKQVADDSFAAKGLTKETIAVIQKNTTDVIPGLEETAIKAENREQAAKSEIQTRVLFLKANDDKYKEKTDIEIEIAMRDGKVKDVDIPPMLSEEKSAVEASEKANDVLQATKIIDELGKFRAGRDAVLKEDITETDSEFLEKFEAAELALADLQDDKSKIVNYGLFLDIQKGKLRMEHVIVVEEKMKDLEPSQDNPSSSDWEDVELVIKEVQQGRRYGEMNELLGGTEKITAFLEVARRVHHMKTKDEVNERHENLKKEYPNPLELTEKDFNNLALTVPVDKLKSTIESYNMDEEQDKAKYPNKKVPKYESWDNKYLEKGTVDNINEYVMRRKQIDATRSFITSLEDVPPVLEKAGNSYYKEKLDEDAAKAYTTMIRQHFVILSDLYSGAGSDTFSSDLDEMGKRNQIEELEQILENLAYSLNKYTTKDIRETLPIKIEDGKITFPEGESAELGTG